MIAYSVASADVALARLERWLDTMRGIGGYGGPVVHWWRDCLVFCGPGLDWRYEGIIAGYLSLFERTEQSCWLEKARRAGDDLVLGQLPGGHFRNSRFELNPGLAGTPHEAAADIGLLLLARTLRERGCDGHETYLNTAEVNLRCSYIRRLWCPSERRFRDDPNGQTFVPNKAASLIEALCLLADLTDKQAILEDYVRPTADAILEHQLRSPGSLLDGGIAQNSVGRRLITKYFPYYNARCVPGLIAAYERLGDRRYLDAALRTAAFVARWCDRSGALPQVIYGNGRVNRYPRWIAASGDVLRVFEQVRQYGFEGDVEPIRYRLLAGQLPSGGFKSAEGFASQVSQNPPVGLPDARDLLPVVGWNDKAFRYLATQVVRLPNAVRSQMISTSRCTHRGRTVDFIETDRAIELRYDRADAYRWQKGTDWAEVPKAWASTA